MNTALVNPDPEPQKGLAAVDPEKILALLKAAGVEGVEALSAEDQVALVKALQADITNASQQSQYRPARFGIDHRSRKFRNDLGELLQELKGVVIYFHRARGQWAEGEKAPRCSSMDGVHGTNAEDEQIACATCPLNPQVNGRWGDKDNCKELKRLYVLLEGERYPVLLTLPPTSLRPWDQFESAVRRRGKALISFYTIFGLDSAEAHGQSFAKIAPKMGPGLSAQVILQLAKIKDEVVRVAAEIGVEADDYAKSEDEAPAAPSDGF